MATFKQLKTFITVAEYRKMSAAAKHLYISQPTVSQIISELEQEYGSQLFERSSRELRITPAGELLLRSAREIIAIHENLTQTMQNIHSVRPLRVGATLTVGNTLMANLIQKLTQERPDIDVSVFIDNTRKIEELLIHNDLDIALVEGVICREDILTEPIIEDSLCLFCSKEHPFASRERISIEELRNQVFIMREPGSGTRDIFEDIMRRHHISYVTKWECSSGTAILDAVRNNLGLGVLSRRCVSRAAKKGSVSLCTIEGVPMKRFFSICYNQSHPVTSQMQDFIDFAKETE